ncbi:MAG: hypothetical protein HUJ31_01645 [Pseudomonadales bacterium]|nr:hypothetical protein [Pseudomonadales bacterium]
MALATMALMISPFSMANQHEQMDQQERARLAAEGARYWSSQCGRCHNLRDPAEFTDDIWDVSVNHMRIRANIPVDQIRAIKAFLKSSN